MRKIFFLFVLAMLDLTFYSCKTDTDDLWDSIHQLDERVVALEEMCKQMNGNIGSLQVLVSALQNNNSVTAVIPVKQGDKTIGYTISFAKGDPITIYHGAKGEQGDKGDDGTTPIIGVKRHTDGTHYWTLNGDWLRDNSGKMIKAEGKDGTDGEQGGQGSPGITPQLKIENGYWWVSYGNDSQWTKLDKAILDSGESIFKKVAQDSKYAYFTLKDGTVITIQKYQKLSITFAEGDELKFDANETKTVHYTIKSEGNMNVVKVDMLNDDNRYSLHTDIIDDTSGTITITTSIPAVNKVIVRLSNAEVTIMAAISLKPSFTENTINVLEAGTLGIWLDSYDKNAITALKITGPLNSNDIAAIKGLSQLTILDLENADLEEFPSGIFSDERKLLISIIFPKTLKRIGNQAFSGRSDLKGNLVIPSSVTSIGSSAFYGCSGLRGELVLPSGLVSIEWGVFTGCSGFTGKLNIPSSVTYIEDWAFSDCGGFTGELRIPPGVTAIGTCAFQECNGFTGRLEIPSSVTSIGSSAFYGCSSFRGELVLPSGLVSIESAIFYGCSGFTGKLNIPSSVTSIRDLAFSNCSGFTGDLKMPLGVTSIGSSAFQGCSGFTGMLGISPNVTSIGNGAFRGCNGFTGKLKIPSGVTSIEGYTFYGCSGFTEELIIPSNVTSIGDFAFYGCKGFRGKLDIPSGVISIGKRAFEGCKDLSPIYCRASIPPSVSDDSFANTSKLYVPKGCASVYRNTNGWNKFESIVEF